MVAKYKAQEPLKLHGYCYGVVSAKEMAGSEVLGGYVRKIIANCRLEEVKVF